MSRRRVGATVAITGAVVACWVAPAFAHVSVDPSEAPKGGFAALTFQVPNETEDASTVKIEVKFPDDHPIAEVSVKPVPGWEASVETTTLDQPIQTDEGGEVTEVVSKITWEGGEIKPGEFQEFEVSAGPLPDDVDQLLFPTLQTYDNGDVVSWIEETPSSGAEPEHPAPVLALTAATGEEGHAAGDEESDSGGDSSGLAVAALVVGALGLVVGGIALIRGGRHSHTAS